MVSAVLILPSLYLIAISAYLFVITIAAWLYRPPAEGDENLRFAIVVPAYNEEKGIASMLAQSFAMDYPDDRYAIFVVADNCSDDTALRAREAGASVAERADPENPGKGQALDWFLNTERETLAEFDLILLLDADMQVDPQLLRELAKSFADPNVEVVQGLYDIANPTASWRSALGFAAFGVVNHLRLAGRHALGGSAELKGSGMAFRSQFLLERGWPAHSVTEDVEFSKQLFLEGIRVHYNGNAHVAGENAQSSRQAKVQQKRWESGHGELVRKYFRPFLRNALKQRTVAACDAVFDLLVPPLSLMVIAIGTTAGLSLFVDWRWTVLLLCCGVSLVFCVFSGLILRRAPFKVWLYLLTVPLWLAWKVPLYIGLLLRKPIAAWERTPRDEEL